MDLFARLPEGCISEILSFTSPSDAIRSSSVSKGFKSASDSDTIWERFLLSDYQEIISRSVSPVVCNNYSKKDLYFALCDSPLLLDGGRMSFWLCKSSGKKCYMLRARELHIAGGNWKWTSSKQSRFSEVAELLMGPRLDIGGEMQTKMLSLNTNYAAYLVYQIENNFCGLDSAAKVSIKFDSSSTECDVCEDAYLTPKRPDGRHPEKRKDGWIEMYLGQFFVANGEDKIAMQLRGTESLNWKKGLVIQGIEVRPKKD